MSRAGLLELGDWITAQPAAPSAPPRTSVAVAGAPGTLDEVERARILEVLEQTRWRVSGPRGAALLLGLKPTTLESRMKRLGISRPR